jgi:steroid 5-alpha reductase family enzyme
LEKMSKETAMKKADRAALVIFPVVVLIGLGLAWAGSQGGAMAFGLPLFGLAVGLAYLIQWIVFVPSFLLQTEKFFDLTGSLTYIFITFLIFFLSPVKDARSFLLLTLVLIWAVRLGTFLFRRIHKAGKDDRFDDLKPSFFRFLNVWTIQGLWVSFTAAAAWVAMASANQAALDVFAVVGFLVWVAGFVIEVVADAQKSRFNADPANKGKFIQSGLWSRSRHPNYFGEIVLWVGVAVIALPILQGWQWVALVSPVFVTVLLTRVSGIPLLEQKADKKWGGQPDYEEYKKKTPVLIPRLQQ